MGSEREILEYSTRLPLVKLHRYYAGSAYPRESEREKVRERVDAVRGKCAGRM